MPPSSSFPWTSWLLLPPVALVGLFLPGYLWGRRWGSPAPWLTSFIVSCVILFHAVLLLDLVRVPVAGWSLGSLVLIVSAAGWWVGRRSPTMAVPPQPPPAIARWWLIPAALGLGSVVLHALIDPLSGYDNGFRWDFLAREIIRTGSIGFYPPVSASDFDHYPWCDGIPPLVPILNLWIYLGTGDARPVFTAVRVIAEAALLFHVVFRFARDLWGPSGGPAACAALACSSIVLWSVAIGQETGLTSLGFVAMLYLLDEHRRDPRKPTLVWAGLAGAMAALSRDYAIAFPAAGLLALLWRRAPKADLSLFCRAVLIAAAPWYLRNAWLTGNPLYSHELAGLFPANQVHLAMMEVIRAQVEVWPRAPWSNDIQLFLACGAGLLILLGALGALRAGRRNLPLVAACLLIAALWWASINQTSGGLAYSMRVLSPALALAAVLSGWIASAPHRALRVSLAIIISVACIDAARRSWLLPLRPAAPPLPYSLHPWREIEAEIRRFKQDEAAAEILTLAAGAGVIVDHPVYFTALRERGGHPVSLFSPRSFALVDPRLDWEQAREKLRSEGIRMVVFADANVVRRFSQISPLVQKLTYETRPAVGNMGLRAYDLAVLDSSQPDTP